MRFVLFSSLLIAFSFSAAQNKPGPRPPITPRQIAAGLNKTFEPEARQMLHDQVVRLFGRQNLTPVSYTHLAVYKKQKGRPS